MCAHTAHITAISVNRSQWIQQWGKCCCKAAWLCQLNWRLTFRCIIKWHVKWFELEKWYLYIFLRYNFGFVFVFWFPVTFNKINAIKMTNKTFSGLSRTHSLAHLPKNNNNTHRYSSFRMIWVITWHSLWNITLLRVEIVSLVYYHYVHIQTLIWWTYSFWCFVFVSVENNIISFLQFDAFIWALRAFDWCLETTLSLTLFIICISLISKHNLFEWLYEISATIYRAPPKIQQMNRTITEIFYQPKFETIFQLQLL